MGESEEYLSDLPDPVDTETYNTVDDDLAQLSARIDARALTLPEAKHEFEKLQIRRALLICNGKITGASHYLQMPRPQVSRLVKKYGLKQTHSE